MKLKYIGLAAGFLLGASIALSQIHPWGDLRAADPPTPVILPGSNVSPQVRHIFETKCADCHSNSTHWPIYTRIAPVSWLIESDVHEARHAMDLSNWARYPLDDRTDLLARIAAEVRNNRMPVQRYLWLHPAARLSDADRQAIIAFTHDERKRLRTHTEKPTQETTK